MPGRLRSKSRSMTVEDAKNSRRGHAPSSPQHKRRASRNRSLALLLGSVLVGAMLFPAHAWAETRRIATPADARRLGLESLRRAVRQDGGVPLPTNLDEFITDREAAVQLGKALFWDMQVGSDGVQACASCHFHAGADNRPENSLNPGLRMLFDDHDGDVEGYFNADFAVAHARFELAPPNATLTRENFPFVKTLQSLQRSPEGVIEPGPGNSNDVAGSMGMFRTQFGGVRPGVQVDLGAPLFDPIFNVGTQTTVRATVSRNSPTVINAILNFTNLWDGRASPNFNGIGTFGDQDRGAVIVVNRPDKGLVNERISLHNASLASQVLQPPQSPIEMSFDFSAGGLLRSLPEIGQKLLRPSPETGLPLTPLGLQDVHPQDSVLGALSNAPSPGVSTTYEAMIKKAFRDQYWNSTRRFELPSTPDVTEITHMEANFSLFFGLSLLLYQSTLVADRTPFDRWMETDRFNRGFGKKELAGLNLFVNEGKCLTCHAGPELTKASVREARGGKNLIKAMAMADGGHALYDNGFYNTAVTPATDDAGRGDLDINDQPIASARRVLFKQLGIDEIDLPIIGGDFIPAQAKDGSPVCDDTNANGVCDPDEPILPAFQRVAVDGAFKTPGLRNVELTGPYFHNGGTATLRQVVQFYNRGGNFCRFNFRDLDPTIAPLGLTEDQENQLVDFLVSLTDERVKYRRAPFDHPELRIPKDGLATPTFALRQINAVGAAGSDRPLGPFLDLDPKDAIYTPVGTCSKELPVLPMTK